MGAKLCGIGTLYFSLKSQSFTTIAAGGGGGKQGGHCSQEESVKLIAHCCYWILN